MRRYLGCSLTMICLREETEEANDKESEVGQQVGMESESGAVQMMGRSDPY